MRFDYRTYNLLQLHQKALLLNSEAVFIDHLYESKIIFTLFAYNHYYIEVMVDADTNDLISITAFSDLSRLDKYLNSVSLEEIL